jgi:hypothetical protein
VKGEERVARRLRSDLGIRHCAEKYAGEWSIGNSELQHVKGEKESRSPGTSEQTYASEYEELVDQ